MLSSFTIENFKSFREAATLEFAPLTVLIGANASGKSNARGAAPALVGRAGPQQAGLDALCPPRKPARDPRRGAGSRPQRRARFLAIVPNGSPGVE